MPCGIGVQLGFVSRPSRFDAEAGRLNLKQGNGPDRSVESRSRNRNPLQSYGTHLTIYSFYRHCQAQKLAISLHWVTERQVCNEYPILREEGFGAFYAGGRK